MFPSLRCVSTIICTRIATQLYRLLGISASSVFDSPSRSMSGSGGFPVASFITQSSSDTSSPFGPPTRKSRSMCRMVAYRTFVSRKSSVRSSRIFSAAARKLSLGARVGESANVPAPSPGTPRSAIASNCAFSPGLFSRRYVTKHTFRFRRPEYSSPRDCFPS